MQQSESRTRPGLQVMVSSRHPSDDVKLDRNQVALQGNGFRCGLAEWRNVQDVSCGVPSADLLGSTKLSEIVHDLC
jgi:hypothetical protein